MFQIKSRQKQHDRNISKSINTSFYSTLATSLDENRFPTEVSCYFKRELIGSHKNPQISGSIPECLQRVISLGDYFSSQLIQTFSFCPSGNYWPFSKFNEKF